MLAFLCQQSSLSVKELNEAFLSALTHFFLKQDHFQKA